MNLGHFLVSTAVRTYRGLRGRDPLRSWPRALTSGLAGIVASALPWETCCAHGLGFALGHLLCSWPWALPLGLEMPWRRWRRHIGGNVKGRDPSHLHWLE